MEARIARLESDVAHVCTNVADIKVDLRSLRDKTDTMYVTLVEKIDSVAARLEGKIESDCVRLDSKIDSASDRLTSRMDALDGKLDRLKDSLASAKIWALVLYIAFGAAMLGTMARGFGWI